MRATIPCRQCKTPLGALRAAAGCAIIAGLLFFLPSSAIGAGLAEDRTVAFTLPRAPLTPLREARRPEGARAAPVETFQGRLRIPASLSKVPALVLVLTCHDAAYYEPWLVRLNRWGYATLSFSRCQPPDFLPADAAVAGFAGIGTLDWADGSRAALGAMLHLKALPAIDENRIGIMGWSRPALVAMSGMNSLGYVRQFGQAFAAGVALYPDCHAARGPYAGPLLVVMALDDDWIDNARCTALARATESDPVSITLHRAEGAVHGFDILSFGPPRPADNARINPDRFAVGGGGTLGYSKTASDAAAARIRAFLESAMPTR